MNIIEKLEALPRFADTAQWRTVKVGAPKLIPHTFNELGSAWTTWDIWRVKHGKDTD